MYYKYFLAVNNICAKNVSSSVRMVFAGFKSIVDTVALARQHYGVARFPTKCASLRNSSRPREFCARIHPSHSELGISTLLLTRCTRTSRYLYRARRINFQELSGVCDFVKIIEFYASLNIGHIGIEAALRQIAHGVRINTGGEIMFIYSWDFVFRMRSPESCYSWRPGQFSAQWRPTQTQFI